MDAYKKRQGVSPIYKINIDSVGEILGKEAPYYGHKVNGEGSYFAVCPACDNPIQLIGIFRNSPEAGSKPYGRHYPKNIVGLATYDEAEYLDCPYSNKNWSAFTKRSPKSKMGQKIKQLLKEQFDRVIYILEQDLEMKISKETARKMLKEYLACEGWTYRAATMNNLPWKFAETGCARPLFGRQILVGGELERAIRGKCSEVELVPASDSRYVKVMNNDKQFVKLQYFLHKHHCKLEEEHLCESITMRVYRSDDAEHTVFEKEISINTEYFMNLISLPAERSKGASQQALELLKDRADLWENTAKLSEHKLKLIYKYCCHGDLVRLYDSIFNNYEIGSNTYCDLMYINDVDSIEKEESVGRLISEENIIQYNFIKKYELCLRVIGANGERQGQNFIEFTIFTQEKNLYISDIQVQEINCGYGKKMMEALFDFVRSQRINKITGRLCRSDLKDHEKRLVSFYNRFGFDIIDTPENIKFPKKIEKRL